MESVYSCIELCSALCKGDQIAVKTLVDNGAPVDTSCYPIHYAIKGGNIKCLEMLLNHQPINVNRQVQSTGDTALHLAVRFQQQNVTETCHLLTSHGADASILNSARETAFDLACAWSDAPGDLFRLLLNAKALSPRINLHWRTITTGNVQAMKTLLAFEDEHPSEKLDVNDRRTSIAVAAEEGTLEMLALVFSQYRSEAMGSDMGDSMLHECLGHTYNGDPPLGALLCLIDLGCSSVAYDSVEKKWAVSATNCIIRSRDGEAFDRILSGIPQERVLAFNGAAKHSPNWNPHRNDACNPLAVAVSEEKADCLLKLLQAGFDPSVPLVVTAWAFNFSAPAAEYVNLFSLNAVHCVQWNIYWDEVGVHNLLSAVILAQPFRQLEHVQRAGAVSEFQQKAILPLLAHGANVNASYSNEMPPLVALVCSDLDAQGVEEHCKLLLGAGAYIDYRHEGSPFSSPDLAIAAAVTGRAAILARLMSLLPPRAAIIDLLVDLTNFKLGKWLGAVGPGEYFYLRWQSWMVRGNVARSVQMLLSFTAKSVELRDVVRRVDEHFAVNGDQEDPALTADNLATIVECQQIWESVWESFDRVDSLQHLCRVVIVDTVKRRCSTWGSNFALPVDQLPVPAESELVQSVIQPPVPAGSELVQPVCEYQAEVAENSSECSTFGSEFAQSVDQLPLPKQLKWFVTFKDVVQLDESDVVRMCPHENTAPTALDVD